MSRNQKRVSAGSSIAVLFTFATAAVLKYGLINDPGWYWGLLITIPALVVAVRYKEKHEYKIKSYG